MPRSSGRSSSRPAPAPRAAPAQSRSNTAAAPAAHHPPAQAAPAQGGGMFANMASTAAGVAVGSTMGHGLSNMLFGGGSAAAAPVAELPPPAQYAASQEIAQQGASCSIQAKDFVSCLSATNNDSQSCSYYLEALKACQAAAAPY